MDPAPDLHVSFPREKTEALMRDFARSVGADGITLWRAELGHLVAIANPLEPSVVGLRQSLERGLISKVYLTGQAMLEQALQEHHDPSIDRELGTRGRAMMAVPVGAPAAGDEGGVLSAVILEGSRRAANFSLSSLGLLAALARELEKEAAHP